VIALRWSDVHEQSITIDERYCRGDWAAPKSDASSTTIPVNRKVIERIQRLLTLTLEVKAGTATRRYRAVKCNGPDDLVFQSVQRGRPMRDNNILVRHIKPAGRKLGIGWVNWQVLRRSYATWLRMVGPIPATGNLLCGTPGLRRRPRSTNRIFRNRKCGRSRSSVVW
jgi:integrase